MRSCLRTSMQAWPTLVPPPYTAEWNWVSVCANKDASLTLDDATLTMDGAGTGNVHAIYFCNNNKPNL